MRTHPMDAVDRLEKHAKRCRADGRVGEASIAEELIMRTDTIPPPPPGSEEGSGT